MTTNIEIYARNMDMTERIHDYVNKKVAKLDRYLPGIEDVRVDLAQEKSARSANDRQVAQITVRGKGFILRAEERSDDLFAAFDTANDKIQRRIERFKGKHQHARKEGPSVAELTAEVPEEETGELKPMVARRKRFVLVPMGELEAIEQMTLLGHENFFIFQNADTGLVNVLYKRRDGSCGLIEPETR